MAATADLEALVDPMLSQNAVLVVLTDLSARGARRPRDLRDATGMTTGGVSNLLARLEGGGLISRTSAPVGGDARAVRVDLTEKGREVEQVLTATILESTRRSAIVLKELLLTLEHVGARATVRRRPQPEMAAGSLLITALAAIGDQLTVALSTPQCDFSASLVLMAIADAGPCRPRYLADRLGMTTAGITNTLDRLERENLVTRSTGADTTDQRAVIVSLTLNGRTVVDELATNVDAHRDQLLVAFLDVSRALNLAGPE